MIRIEPFLLLEFHKKQSQGMKNDKNRLIDLIHDF